MYVFIYLCLCVFVCMFVPLRSVDCMLRLSCYLGSTSHMVTPRDLFLVWKKGRYFAKISWKTTKIGLIWCKSSQNHIIFEKWCRNCACICLPLFLGPKCDVDHVFRGYFCIFARKIRFGCKNMLFFDFFQSSKNDFFPSFRPIFCSSVGYSRLPPVYNVTTHHIF